MSDYTDKTPDTAPIVKVEWEDIYFSDNWEENGQTIQPIESVTLGFLLHENDHMIILGGSYDYRREQWGTIHAISKVTPRVSLLGYGKIKETPCVDQSQ